MENWKAYHEGEIPENVYYGKLSYMEDNNPIIELESWEDSKITNYIKIEFNQVYSVRVFEEGKALNAIFEDMMKFSPDFTMNVIYEVENGDYANEVKKIAGRKLAEARIYQYVIVTENYYFEIVADSEPIITMMKEKEYNEIGFSYYQSYEQKKVDLIFQHLDEPVYMPKDESYYDTYLELPEGEYHYKYIIDDGLELIDKGNKGICIDDGNYWSVLHIAKEGVIDKEIESSATLCEYGIFDKMMEVVPNKNEIKLFNADKDKKAVCILGFNEVQGLHVVTVAWYKPDGELYRFTENDFGSYEETDDDKVMLRFWLNLDEINEADFGRWTVRAFLDGEMIKEDNIIISSNAEAKIDVEI